MIAVFTEGPKLCTVIGRGATGAGSPRESVAVDGAEAGDDWALPDSPLPADGPADVGVAPLAGAQAPRSPATTSPATHPAHIDGPIPGAPSRPPRDPR